MIRRIAIYSIALFYSIFIYAQFPDKVGTPSCDAIDAHSTLIQNWAISCDIKRGSIHIADSFAESAGFGNTNNALGKADNKVISLGDGGIATVTFHKPIVDGPGADFAVFENSFEDHFLELAFVEVSSDGINFVRFPSHSLTDTTLQTNTFGTTDATKINNLAGKYRGSYGTPFDLQELAGNTNLNINAITHVKIIDVVGSVNKQYAKRDSYNNMINDPWPTPFPNGGFDLDAIGVIHQNTSVGLKENDLDEKLSLYPNPIKKGETILLSTSKDILFTRAQKRFEKRR